MKHAFVLALLLGTVGVTWLSAQPPAGDKPSAALLGLEVRKMPPLNTVNLGDAPLGTVLRVLLSLPGKQALVVDTKASKLTSLQDDKGTDITKPSKMGSTFETPWLNDFDSRVSSDRKNASVRIVCPGVPAEGAAKLALKADIVVLCGTDEQKAEAENVELKPDKTTKIGPMLVRYDKNSSFGNNTSVAFVCQDAPRVKSVTFLDKDGQAYRSHINRNTRTNDKDRNEWICYISVEAKIEQATVRVIYFDKLETVTVPVELQVGVGF